MVTRAEPNVQLTGLTEDLAADFIPPFAGGHYTYSLVAASDETTVDIVPTLEGATITWNIDTDAKADPTPVSSGEAATIPLDPGNNLITIYVEKAGTEARNYFIVVTRLVPYELTGLTENLAADLEPAFVGWVPVYTLAATNDEETVDIVPTLEGATITWNIDTDAKADPTPVNSGEAATIPLVVGANTVLIHVEKDETAWNYQITVTRAAP
jgi:hypothetical protein